MDVKDFEKKINQFRRATTSAMKLAVELSLAALKHFADHDDTSWLKRFCDSMPRNFLRQDAFIKWAVNFAPIVIKDGRWLKDKTRAGEEVDMEGAAKKSFWDFAPAPEIVNFGHDDVVKKLRAVVRTFRNKRHTAQDDKAEADVVKLEDFIDTLEENTAADTEEQPETENVPQAEQAAA